MVLSFIMMNYNLIIITIIVVIIYISLISILFLVSGLVGINILSFNYNNDIGNLNNYSIYDG